MFVVIRFSIMNPETKACVDFYQQLKTCVLHQLRQRPQRAEPALSRGEHQSSGFDPGSYRSQNCQVHLEQSSAYSLFVPMLMLMDFARVLQMSLCQYYI